MKVELIVLVTTLYLCCGVLGGAFNFPFTSPFTYGAPTETTLGSTLSAPADFIIFKERPTLFVVSLNLVLYEVRQTSHNPNSLVQLPTNNSALFYYSLEQLSNATFALGRRGSIEFRPTYGAAYGPLPNYLDVGTSGMYYDSTTNYLYFSYSDGLNTSRVSILDLTNSIVTSTIYGGAQDPIGPATLRLPRHIRKCNNTLWIVDYLNKRVLGYLGNDTSATFVLGQPNFTASVGVPGAGSRLATGSRFQYPSDIVFTNDCSYAFVADDNRILRFKAPFTSSGITAEGVLGSDSLDNYDSYGLSATSFGSISRLQLEDYGNSTGRLYVCDGNTNGRIVSGTTSWGVALPSYIPQPSNSPIITTNGGTITTTGDTTTTTTTSSASGMWNWSQWLNA